MAIPKKFRLNKKSDFKILLASGQIHNLSFAKVLTSKEKTSLDTPRFAIVVSKTIDKRATVRNSLRRMVSKPIEETLKSTSLPSYDYIFFIKKPILQTSYEEVVTNVKNTLITK